MSSSTLTEQWKTDPPAIVRLYYQLAMDALGLVMNQLIEHRHNPGSQEIIDACVRTHNAMHDQTGIASFMRQYVVADRPISVGPHLIDCWHTLAIAVAARFVEDCKARTFDEAASALQRFLCGENPPTAPVPELVRGALVQVQAEQKRALDTFPKLLDQFRQLKAKWIAEHDATATDAATHSEDFTSVIWFGTPFTFSKGMQAESVRHLWEAWAKKTPTLSEKTIGDKIGSSADGFQLAKVFRTKKKTRGHSSSRVGNDDSARRQRNIPARSARKDTPESRILVPTPLRPCAACHNRGMDTKLSTLRDLANRFKRFGLSVAWLKAEAEAGRLPCFKAGRKLLFDLEAVEQSLLQRARIAQESEASNER